MNIRCTSGVAARFTLAMVLFSVAWPVPSNACTSTANIEKMEAIDKEYDEDWEFLLETMTTLENGSRSEKLAMLYDENGDREPFWVLDIPPSDDPDDTERQVQRLLNYSRNERDTWVLDRVLSSLASESILEASPVMSAMLQHPAPSVRLRALEGFNLNEAENSLETLENMWAEELPSWLRAELLKHLIGYQSQVQRDDCERLLYHPDQDLAAVAILCMTDRNRPEAPAALASVVRDTKGTLQIKALHALASMFYGGLEEPHREVLEILEPLWRNGPPEWLQPDLLQVLDMAGSDMAFDAALDMLDSPDSRAARIAMSIICRSNRPESSTTLQRIALSGPADLRAGAIRAALTAGITEETMQLLVSSSDPQQPRDVRLAAVTAAGTVFHKPGDLWINPFDTDVNSDLLRSREPVLALLRAIGNSDPVPNIREEAWRSEAQILEGTLGADFTCFYDLNRDDLHTLVTNDGNDSLRCYKAPGIEAAPDRAVRVNTGGWLEIWDIFDDGTFVWRSFILGGNNIECWVPSKNFRRIEPWEEIQDEATISVMEFDLPAEMTDTDDFRRLEQHSLVKTFDQGTFLTGVRLTLEPSDDIGLEVLRRQPEWSATALGKAVRALSPDSTKPGGALEDWHTPAE